MLSGYFVSAIYKNQMNIEKYIASASVRMTVYKYSLLKMFYHLSRTTFCIKIHATDLFFVLHIQTINYFLLHVDIKLLILFFHYANAVQQVIFR